MLTNEQMKDYEAKFSKFIEMCNYKPKDGEPIGAVIINHPSVLGDDYEEICESLGRIAKSHRALLIRTDNDTARSEVLTNNK